MTYTIFAADNSTDTVTRTATSRREANATAKSLRNDLTGGAGKVQIVTGSSVLAQWSQQNGERWYTVIPDARPIVSAAE